MGKGYGQQVKHLLELEKGKEQLQILEQMHIWLFKHLTFESKWTILIQRNKPQIDLDQRFLYLTI